MNTERVEAAAKAFDKAFAEEILSGRSPSANDWKVAGLRAALTAADSASGERDIRTPVKVGPTATAGVCVLLTYQSGPVEGVSQELYIAPGEELVVRKVRANG